MKVWMMIKENLIYDAQKCLDDAKTDLGWLSADSDYSFTVLVYITRRLVHCNSDVSFQ